MALKEKTNLRNSIFDGMFANMFATLTGGVFLTGFALYLGMNEFMIGLLASMPFLVTIFQLPASYLIEKKGGRKKISFLGAFFARMLWILVLIVALLPISQGPNKSLVILSLIFISYAFASMSYVSWLSWISDLVPDEIRGRFFGTRNMLCGAVGMVVLVAFGKLMDLLNGHSLGALPLGFLITFMAAVFLGMFSLYFLKKISEPLPRPIRANNSFGRNIMLPFEDPNFRKFLIFAFSWSFSVYFASPFFTLYFLRELKFSYSFVATLGMLSAFADMAGMQLWGKISDKVKNKAVIQFAGWVAVFLPLAWVTVRPDSIVMPTVLHFVGGGFWAGINLCMNNLLLRIAPEGNRTLSLTIYNIMGGLGAAAGPILAGFVLNSISHMNFQWFSQDLMPLHIIFMTSTLLRLLSFQLFKAVHEPEAVKVGQMVRILRGVRGLNMATGFNYLLHPFVLTDQNDRKP